MTFYYIQNVLSCPDDLFQYPAIYIKIMECYQLWERSQNRHLSERTCTI